MAQKIPDSLIDEILESTKKYQGAEETEKYSGDRIDRLLADISEAKALNSEKAKTNSPLSEAEKETAEPQKAEKQPAEEKIKRNRFSFSISKNPIDAEESDEETTVALEVEDDGQISLTSDGDKISAEENEEQIEEPKEELKSVSGQISIEKTRMFNEVKIHSEYNPKISHNLGNKVARTTTGEAQPLSTPVMSEEKYRNHFMNKPVQNLEKTQEHRKAVEGLPEKTIETPGVVIKHKSKIANTDGFQAVPTLVPAEYELEQEKTRLDLPKNEIQEEPEDNQIMFEGFNDVEEIPVKQSEEETEAELRQARKGKVDEFVNNGLLFKQEVEETEHRRRYDRQKISVAREYFGAKDKAVIEKIYETERVTLIAKTVALTMISVVMAVLASVAGTDNGNFEIYGNNEFVYVAVQGILLLIACLINFKSFKGAFASLKNKIVDMDCVIVVSAIVGFLQCAVGFVFTDNVEAVAKMVTAAAVVPMIFKTLGELVGNRTDYNNFEILSDEENDLYAVENIKDEETADEIARGLMIAEPEIKYSGKAEFYSKFIEISRSAEVNGKLLKIAIPAVLGVGVVAGIVYGIVSQNVFAGISTMTGVVLMGLPCAASLLTAVNISAANKKLNEENTFINGYSAVEDAVNSNGVVIDACDAFVSGGCNIEGIKLYHKMRIDEAIQYTATVVIASGGVLADVFDGVIVGKRELLFPVETLAYEEKLGCSCWIHNHRVLVGNRELLVHHNVEVPDKELEEKFKSNGRNVIYLAIEGKISAMFVVTYKANEETARYMQELEKDGLTIFFRTSDANITEQFVEREFGLPANVVKMINPVAGDMFTKVKNTDAERTDAKIIHDGTVRTMLASIHSAFAVHSFVNVLRTVQFVLSFLGIAIVIILSFMSGLAQIGVWQIIIYQVLGTAVLSLLSEFRKNNLRR